MYYATLELPAKFLNDRCAGDEGLLAEVESLLLSHEQTGDFLAEPDFILGLKLLALPSQKLKAGKKFGDYFIIEVLGRGGMGEVYVAQDERLKRKVALKLLAGDLAAQDNLSERFRREARSAAAVSHPNIAHIYEVGEINSTLYISMDYIEGETLRQHLRQKERLPQDEAVRIAVQIVSALIAAHNLGIVHRDIKPENIVLRPDGLIKVLDFGLAKPTQTAALAENETERGFILGTTRYMSPEQARGVALDERTDIWSLGVVLYEMLAGKAPFEGETKSDIIAEILKAEPPEFVNERDDYPTALLSEIIRRSSAKEPVERYTTAAELRNDLQQILETRPNSQITFLSKRAKFIFTGIPILLLLMVIIISVALF